MRRVARYALLVLVFSTGFGAGLLMGGVLLQESTHPREYDRVQEPAGSTSTEADAALSAEIRSRRHFAGQVANFRERAPKRWAAFALLCDSIDTTARAERIARLDSIARNADITSRFEAAQRLKRLRGRSHPHYFPAESRPEIVAAALSSSAASGMRGVLVDHLLSATAPLVTPAAMAATGYRLFRGTHTTKLKVKDWLMERGIAEEWAEEASIRLEPLITSSATKRFSVALMGGGVGGSVAVILYELIDNDLDRQSPLFRFLVWFLPALVSGFVAVAVFISLQSRGWLR